MFHGIKAVKISSDNSWTASLPTCQNILALIVSRIWLYQRRKYYEMKRPRLLHEVNAWRGKTSTVVTEPPYVRCMITGH